MGFLASFLLLTGGVFLNCTFAQQAATRPSHAGPTTSMQGAKTPAELAQIFKQRLGTATDDQLQKYISGDDAGDAIAASWDLVRRSMIAAWANVQGPKPPVVAPDKESVSLFLDIVDARTGGAPAFWRNAVASVAYRPPDRYTRAIGFSNFRGLGAPAASVQLQGQNEVVTDGQGNHWTLPGHTGGITRPHGRWRCQRGLDGRGCVRGHVQWLSGDPVSAVRHQPQFQCHPLDEPGLGSGRLHAAWWLGRVCPRQNGTEDKPGCADRVRRGR